MSLSLSCVHPSTSPTATPTLQRFSSKNLKANYVLDSEVMMSIKNLKGRPVIQVDLPHSRGCQVTLDEEYPGVVFPEHITNSPEKADPIVFVLKYDSHCFHIFSLS